MEHDDCIFCKIAQKKVRSHIVYEDEHFVAFLDINPHAKGHTLIISKQHYTNIFSLPKTLGNDLLKALQHVKDKILPIVGTTDCSILTRSGALAGQEVFHVHVHLVP